MRLEWTLQALGDLRETAAFINRDNPSAAARIADRIQQRRKSFLIILTSAAPEECNLPEKWSFRAPR
jgi:hypothetical protein